MSDTGHYQAINQVLWYACPRIRTPLLDITAGTGEPLKYVLGWIEHARELRCTIPRMDELISRLPHDKSIFDHDCPTYANEISQRMLYIARGKLSNHRVVFTHHSAYDLPEDMAGGFNTVLCSQTFHLIPEEDKMRLVKSIHRALADDGIAIVIEEDPFRISPTPQIEPVSLFLRSIVCPVKIRTLIAYFETNGFTPLVETAVAPIDSEHAMHLHMFRKEKIKKDLGLTNQRS